MRVLLVGGSSEIGIAVAEALTRRDPSAVVVLAGRASEEREAARERLTRGGRETAVVAYDASWDAGRTAAMFDAAERAGGEPDVVVVAVGAMAAPASDTEDVAEPDLERVLRTNLNGPALVANEAVRRFSGRGRGELVVLTSASAVRPRDGILGYAVAKQALDSFVRGLDRRARPHGVRCRVVRPGQVRTRMTAGLAEAPLTTDPARVADRVRTGLKRDGGVVWSPAAMRPVTAALRLTPARALPRELR